MTTKRLLSKTVLLGSWWLAAAQPAQSQADPDRLPLPRVAFQTSMGDFVLELDSTKAPITVANFLGLVEAGFYDELVFHRVLRRAVVQVGIMDGDGNLTGLDHPPIANEADNRVRHGRGTVAMARGEDPASATTEFFVNVKDNWDYDFNAYTKAGWGYAVFGRVAEGMDVIEAIARLDTRRLGPFRNFPKTPVMIYAAYRLP